MLVDAFDKLDLIESYASGVRRIIKLLKKNPKYTIKEMSTLLNVSDKTVKRDIDALKKEGVLYRTGSLFDGNWIVK